MHIYNYIMFALFCKSSFCFLNMFPLNNRTMLQFITSQRGKRTLILEDEKNFEIRFNEKSWLKSWRCSKRLWQAFIHNDLFVEKKLNHSHCVLFHEREVEK